MTKIKTIIFMTPLLFGAFILALTSCGTDNPKPQMKIEKDDSVFIFSAPWCEACHVELPKVLKPLKDKNIRVIVFLETGTLPSQHPTDEDAAKYKAELGVNVAVVPDPWRWKTYRAYFTQGYTLPAAVVVDKNEKVKKKIGPGNISDSILLMLK
jgi:thiol-disulfide isomerase/thioredoxin